MKWKHLYIQSNNHAKVRKTKYLSTKNKSTTCKKVLINLK